MKPFLSALLVALMAFLGGCDESGEDQLLSVDGSRSPVEVQLFADLNRSGSLDGDDRILVGHQVAIRFRGTLDTIAVALTGNDGVAGFTGIPPGTFEVLIDPVPLGDSLELSQQTPDPFRVFPRAVNPVDVGVSYPIVSIAEARASDPGRRIFVRGVAVNASGALPGDALHLMGESGWIRAENTSGSTVSEGDSVRVRGTVQQVGGGIVLAGGLRAVTGGSAPIEPIPTTTSEAQSASGGRDGALVSLTAQVNQTVFQGGVATSQISDGSGTVFLQIPSGHLNSAGLPLPRAGTTMELTGVLIPQANSTWVLRTRGAGDVAITSRGGMLGTIFVDQSRTGEFDPDLDEPVEGVRVQLRATQLAGGVIAEGFTGSDGTFRFEDLPTGSYQIELDPFTVPPNLTIGSITPTPINVLVGQETDVIVPLVPPPTEG